VKLSNLIHESAIDQGQLSRGCNNIKGYSRPSNFTRDDTSSPFQGEMKLNFKDTPFFLRQKKEKSVNEEGIHVILEVQRSSKSEAEKEALRKQELETVRQRDEDLFREIAMLILAIHYCATRRGNSGSAWAVPDKDDIVEDASEIDQIGVNEAVETQTLMKEVGPDGEKQAKEVISGFLSV
nr:hypothetical protein [Tanacetum cinerariifolium]